MSGPEGLIPSWNGVPLRPMTGGYGGETFCVGDPDDPTAAILRIYARDPQRCAVDTALLRLLVGILPVPRVLESRPADAEMPGVLVVEKLPGTPLDQVLDDPRTDDSMRARLGASVGRVLARLSGVPMPAAGGFVDSSLVVVRDGFDVDLDDFLARARVDTRISSWPDQEFRALQTLADSVQTRMEAVDDADASVCGRHVLVHSDFNPKNVLVDVESGDVTGLVDWEYSHAGSPYTDLGNMLRFRRDAAFGDAVAETFVANAPPLRPEPVTLARCQDLWALIDLAGRPTQDRAARSAAELLKYQALEGDVHAWPWGERTVPPGEGPL